jgi:hypothetical protein
MNLEIGCKGIENASCVGQGYMDITLSDVTPDFIEQLEIRDIMMYADQQKLMNEFDYDELVSYLEFKYDVKVEEVK